MGPRRGFRLDLAISGGVRSVKLSPRSRPAGGGSIVGTRHRLKLDLTIPGVCDLRNCHLTLVPALFPLSQGLKQLPPSNSCPSIDVLRAAQFASLPSSVRRKYNSLPRYPPEEIFPTFWPRVAHGLDASPRQLFCFGAAFPVRGPVGGGATTVGVGMRRRRGGGSTIGGVRRRWVGDEMAVSRGCDDGACVTTVRAWHDSARPDPLGYDGRGGGTTERV